MQVNSTGGAGQTGVASTSTPNAQSGVPDAQVFLQLLVAQLSNQDPLQPADGMQFVTQLAQFSQLEQLVAMRADLAALSAAATTPTTDLP